MKRIITLLIIVISCGILHGQNNGALITINGKITWYDEPVCYADITLMYPDGHIDRFKSDMYGCFTKTLPYGKYSISIIKESYNDYNNEFELDNELDNTYQGSVYYPIEMHREIITVSGRVTCNGYPLSKIEVYGYNHGTGKEYLDYTDNNGYYSMTVPGIGTDGVFEIIVNDSNYEFYHKSFYGRSNFRGSQLCNIDLTMATTNANDNSNSYSNYSSDDSTLDAVGTLIAGVILVGAFIEAVSSSNSGSSSGSNNDYNNNNYNNSNNNNATPNSENVMSMGNVVINRADLYDHNVLTGKNDNIIMYMENDNNRDVIVNVEMKVNGTWKPCRITYKDRAATEPLNGSYSDDGKKDIHLKWNSVRVVEVTSYSMRRPDAIRITNVF